MKIKPKKYIVWFKDEVDLDSPFQRKWFTQQVLLKGRTEDIIDLDLHEVKLLLPQLELPKPIRRLWENYYAFKELE